MPFQANLGGYEFKEHSIYDNSHPPIIVSHRFRPGAGTYKAGTLLARDDTRLWGPYVRGAADWSGKVKGILTLDIDTAKETVGNVFKHGVIRKDALLVGTDEAPVNESEIDALNDIQIYPR